MTTKISLELAQCAREKIQASAREIWSSFRSFDDLAKKSSQEEDESPTLTAEGTASMSLEKINDVFKVMFGSCTTGIPHKSHACEPDPAVVPYTEKRSRSGDFLSSREIGEHVYEQLFMDDQARATRAVDGLRERAASSPSTSRPPHQHLRDPYNMVSSPSQRNLPPPGQSIPVAPPTTKAVDISNNFSFDDGISAISAHTLDEMARVYDHKATSLSMRSTASNRPEKVESISHPRSSRSMRNEGEPHHFPPLPSIMTPLKFSRGRSHGTHGSKATKSSKSTKSTNSTQDSEFASVWRKEERKYWDDVVEQDKRNYAMNGTPTSSKRSQNSRRRSRCGSHSTKHDITVTTACSSSYSNFSSQFDKHHPINFIAKEFVSSTRDLVEIPFNPSELGEI